MNQKLDTNTHVFFYEQEFYVLSNFSSFRVMWKARDFDTSEHVYHWEKFLCHPNIQHQILQSRSADDALRIARAYSDYVNPSWNIVKVAIMKEILKAKVRQHEYVERKLLETGDRYLVEDSWRDDFWGWGPNNDGKNMLGKLWMEIRDELRIQKSM